MYFQDLTRKDEHFKLNVSPIRPNNGPQNLLCLKEENQTFLRTCKRTEQDVILEMDDETSMTPASCKIDRDRSFEKEGGQCDEDIAPPKASQKRSKNGNNITNKELKKEISKFMDKIDRDKSQALKQTVRTPGYKTQKTFNKSPTKINSSQMKQTMGTDMSQMTMMNISGVEESAAGHIDSLKT
jgi:hypothetical protein